MPTIKGLVEETQDEIAIEFDTVSVADGGTFDTHISNPQTVFLQTTAGNSNFAEVTDITGTTVTVSLTDDAAASVGVAEAIDYIALGTP